MNRYNLRLTSKKLRSGKYQVRFETTALLDRSRYGYILVEPKTTVREVVERIETKLDNLFLGKLIWSKENAMRDVPLNNEALLIFDNEL